ncbi:MAG: 4-hydroxy-tetrahydrodipicolinate reductase, partial [Dethiobacteria bacterium]
MKKIKVAVNGACGRMGREVCNAILNEGKDLELTGALDVNNLGEDIGSILGLSKLNIPVVEPTTDNLLQLKPDVIVDFTTPLVVMDNIKLALQCNVRPIVGTTGITQVDLNRIRKWVEDRRLSALIAPNFALGAVLMMKFASIAAQYLPQAEIIELHHDQKIDAPSGTSLKTAEMIAANRLTDPPHKEDLQKLAGVRGGIKNGIHIHSLRLNGLVAHQEVIFGGEGQTLTIRHDSYDRKSFMPGIIMAVKKIISLEGLFYGLET